jgi:hypothetical protein
VFIYGGLITLYAIIYSRNSFQKDQNDSKLDSDIVMPAIYSVLALLGLLVIFTIIARRKGIKIRKNPEHENSVLPWYYDLFPGTKADHHEIVRPGKGGLIFVPDMAYQLARIDVVTSMFIFGYWIIVIIVAAYYGAGKLDSASFGRALIKLGMIVMTVRVIVGLCLTLFIFPEFRWRERLQFVLYE